MGKKRVTKKVSKTLSLGGLRKALEHIKGCAGKMGVPEFQKEYKKVFHKNISPKDAKAYIQSLKASRQSGGAAPLHYELQAGGETPYGSYPAYLTGGFGFANVNSTLGDAAEVSKFPSPATGMGSNLVGGAKGKRATRRKGKIQKGGAGVLDVTLSNVAEVFSRPFPATAPASIGNDVQLLSKGLPGFDSPRPEFHSPHIPTTNIVHSVQASAASKIV
jgi:hypothetical protein